MLHGLPILSGLLSLPLALGAVGPNNIYGFRTSASLSSEPAWYRANELAGWGGLAAAVAAFLLSTAIMRSKAPPERLRPLLAVLASAALALLGASTPLWVAP